MLAGLCFLMIFVMFPPITPEASVNTVFYLLITCILLVITIYDMKHKIIPDALVYTFALVSLGKLFISPELAFVVPSIMDVLAGPLLALPFALMWLLSRGTWMGLGDAKLVLGIGWVLGLVPGISAIILAFWIGAIISLVWMYVVVKKFKARYEIPFGPYLILGMYLVLFFGIKVIELPL
jgi:leader peptidase (prepilin peptidase)/N-methyltransferase